MRTLSMFAVGACLLNGTPCLAQPAGPAAPRPYIVEAYPPALTSAIKAKLDDLAGFEGLITTVPRSVIGPTLVLWQPGQTLRVAFEGGDDALYGKIENLVARWTAPDAAFLTFSFKGENGHYRHWDPDHPTTAEIRVAFRTDEDWKGYWSQVGRDSLSSETPQVPSLNLEAFDAGLPSNWEAVVLHEFGHALGFQHEHQSPKGGCDFRFDDDPGYEDTQDEMKMYIDDKNGKRPGLYKYLSGYPNFWKKNRVDDNLSKIKDARPYRFISDVDKFSVMKYQFDAAMFITGTDSPCFTETENADLSPLDKIGAHSVYNPDPLTNLILVSQQQQIIEQIMAASPEKKLLSKQLADQLDALKEGESPAR